MELITSRKPRVAVIGYGVAGRSFHSYLIGLTPALELYAIAARDTEKRKRAAAERGCRVFADFDEAIADPAVDLVVLATPHDTHAPLAIRALEAGKHVVTDKVMCLSLAECDAMIDAARRADRLLTVFHNRRLDGDFLTLRKVMDEKSIGDVRWVEMAWQKPPASLAWRVRRANGGGRIYDLGAHLLDQLLLLFPSQVEGVHCRMHTDFPSLDVESHALITLAFVGGFTGVCDVSSMARHPKPRIYAIGTHATLVKHGVDPQEAAMVAGDIDAAREPATAFARAYDGKSEQAILALPGRWRSFYENIADVLIRGSEPLVKLPEMRRLMGVIDAVFESAREGRVVRPRGAG